MILLGFANFKPCKDDKHGSDDEGNDRNEVKKQGKSHSTIMIKSVEITSSGEKQEYSAKQTAKKDRERHNKRKDDPSLE